MINYRMAFRALATYSYNIEKNPQKSLAVLARMDSLIPQSKVPYGWEYAWEMAGLYYTLGKMDKVKDMAAEIEPACQQLIAGGGANVNSYYNPYRALIDLYEMTKEYDKSLELFRKLEVLYPKDNNLQQRIQMLEQLVKQSPTASSGAIK
jgi:tetratricopeptide (TPR) repeat protein